MSRHIIGLFLVLTSCSAWSERLWAAPSPRALELINSGYDPRVTTRDLSSEEQGLPGILSCRITHMEIFGRDPVNGRNRKVWVRRFEANFAPPAPRTVIVIPPIAGITAADEAYAYAFCVLGIRTILLDGWDYDERHRLDFASHDQEQVRVLTAIRHILDALGPMRKTQVGLIGTSAGAIAGGLVLAFEPRISAGALIVGGVDLVEILARSEQHDIRSLRLARMKHFGLNSIDEYRAALKKQVHIEPLDFVGYSGPKRLLTVIADQDDYVPTENQWRLYRAFGSQELIQYRGSHVAAVVDTLVSRHRDLIEFLARNLQ